LVSAVVEIGFFGNTGNPMPKKFFEDKRPHNGLTCQLYIEKFKTQAEENKNSRIKLNFQRSTRINPKFVIRKTLMTNRLRFSKGLNAV